MNDAPCESSSGLADSAARVLSVPDPPVNTLAADVAPSGTAATDPVANPPSEDESVSSDASLSSAAAGDPKRRVLVGPMTAERPSSTPELYPNEVEEADGVETEGAIAPETGQGRSLGLLESDPSRRASRGSSSGAPSENEVNREAMRPAADREAGESSPSQEEFPAGSSTDERAGCAGHLSNRGAPTGTGTNSDLVCQEAGEASIESDPPRNKDLGEDREAMQLPTSNLPGGQVDVFQSISERGSDGGKSGERWAPVSVPAAGLDAADSASERDTTLMVVARRVMVLSREAEDLASRGAYYAARAKMIKSLRIITQALDSRKTGKRHSEALGRAKQAFREVGDFAPRGSLLEAELDVAQIISAHRTTILQDVNVEHLTPLAVRQKYLEYAQRQFAEACDGLPIGSYALYGLGRVHAVMARAEIDKQMLCLPKAVTLHQAALLVDSNNVQAANELGVLLAKFGQLKDARRALRHALSIESRSEIWMNLAAVHQQLGERELAHEARENGTLMASRQDEREQQNRDVGIKWVDPKTFSETRVWHLR
ncbi:MAG: hypothetical protein ACQESR_21845 [Planctomycetota bacterium]